MRETLLSSPRRRGNRLRNFAIVFVLFGVCSQACFWTLTRPPIPDVVVPDVPEPIVGGTKATVGGSSLERRDGYWFMLHTGDAVTLGAEHARLGGFLTQRAEDVMRADFERRLPAPLKVVLPPVLMWRFRHLGSSIPTPLLEELYGFGTTYPDRTPFPLNAYQRGIYYHALHDMVQDLVGNKFVDPGVAGACTGFAASGSGTTDGHTIVGRNFDFEVVPIFDSEKVVHLHAREGAIPVMSVSWMGMSGVLTGMNADGIWISLNAARSEGRNRKGPPVALLVRDVLEQARSIADVERLLAETDPIVTDIYVVADGKTGEIAAFERGQTRMGKRGPEASGKLAIANHLLSETFVGDEDDDKLRTFSTTLARHARMQELVDDAPLSPARGVEILRDRRGPGGRELAPGNRNAIDAWIATHSVVADMTDRVMWVSTAPHAQGAYRVVDMLGELKAAGLPTTEWRRGLADGARAWEASSKVTPKPLRAGIAPELPAGAQPNGPAAELARLVAPPQAPMPPAPDDMPPGDLVQSGEDQTVTRYLALLADSEEYLAHDEPTLALDVARRALALYPLSAEAKRWEAEALAMSGDESAARAAFEDYFTRYPGIGPEYWRAKEWLEAK
ncbi:MAG: hypothetical protein KDA24_04595 [Deltaproteobacteria bacterium]|nr:hypothetical protein [Deltaproteobacteria bacterium]